MTRAKFPVLCLLCVVLVTACLVLLAIVKGAM